MVVVGKRHFFATLVLLAVVVVADLTPAKAAAVVVLRTKTTFPSHPGLATQSLSALAAEQHNLTAKTTAKAVMARSASSGPAQDDNFQSLT